MKNIMVHGAMIYECEKCGKQWYMWLEVGVEGPGGQKAMPCPFTIRCLCKGMAKHIRWESDIDLPEPRPISGSMSYFKLDRDGLEAGKEDACGIPVIRSNSRDLRNGGGRFA